MTAKEIKLNLGCGIVCASGFINIDKYRDYEAMKNKTGTHHLAITPDDAPFLQADIVDLPFPDNYADYIECIDVIEHLPFRNVQKAFDEAYRVLKPGHKACYLTTNFDQLARLWTGYMDGKAFSWDHYYELTEVIYGNQADSGEFHTVPFNPHILKHHLETAGFTFTMTIYPMNTTNVPPCQTLDWPKDTILRTEMIWVEATKPDIA